MLGFEAAMTFFKTEDESEASLLYNLARATREVERQHDLDRASQIANAVGRLFGG